MSYFVVENFGRGTDTRKHILNASVGALFYGKNININRGGEPETCKAFVAKYSLQAGQTFGMLSAGGKLYTFGSAAAPSVPSGVTYQRLQHPKGGNMTAVVHASVVKGKPFVIATFTTGLAVFNNGTSVADWQPSGAGIASYNDVASNFAAVINTNPNYSAVAAGPVVTVTGRNGVIFSVAATATNGGGVNDQTATTATTQASTSGGPETAATATVTFSGVAPIFNPDTGNYDSAPIGSSISINGVEIMGASLVANDDNAAAAAVAAAINSYHSAPDYTAVAVGSVVTITAPAGSGASLNGVSVISDSAYAVTTALSGGVNASSGLPQISTVSFAGTWEAADSYSITLDGTVFLISGVGANGQSPTFSLTKDEKTYAIAANNLFGSKIGDASLWNSGTGSFVKDMSSELSGAETLMALAVFQGHLAVFSRSTVQIQLVDADPANNELLQALKNIGTVAPKSVVEFGDSDVFFLADTGVRSLKVRQATDTATLSDIGSPIDTLIIAAIKAAGSGASKAVAALEPIDGRFMLQIGTVTYVFSFFPDAKVSAWTTYETGLAITEFAVLEQRLYARAGDVIYLLGGDGNDKYSAQPPDVKIPFLSARQIATLKHFTALDVACDGCWDTYIATDPQHPDDEENIATINNSTYGLGVDPFNGEDVTAISLRFVGRAGKYGRIANLAVHYEPLGEAA